jgi:hypothetical protein
MKTEDTNLLKDLSALLLSIDDVIKMKYGTRVTIKDFEQRVTDMRERLQKAQDEK